MSLSCTHPHALSFHLHYVLFVATSQAEAIQLSILNTFLDIYRSVTMAYIRCEIPETDYYI